MNTDESLIQSSSDDTYWANKPIEELSTTVLGAANRYYAEISGRGLWRLWRQVYRSYFGLSEWGEEHAASLISFLGGDGEVLSVRINHLRRLVRRRVTMATASPPGLNPRPTNSDFASAKQVPVARNVVDYFVREKTVVPILRDGLEAVCLFGEAYACVDWDHNAGPVVSETPIVYETQPLDDSGAPLMNPDGTPVLPGDPTGEVKVAYQGDLVIGYETPISIIRPNGCNGAMPWVIRRQFVNKWDLIAVYPEKTDAILNIARRVEDMGFGFFSPEEQSPDTIAVYHFYHAPTPAVPGGRYALIASDDCFLTDGPLPYEEIPIYRMTAGDMIGTDTGYSDTWDMLAIQAACDSAVSSLLTINDAFAIPNVAVEQGTDIASSALTGGMRRWDYPAGGKPPQVINLQEFPNGTFQLVEMFRGDMEALANLNSSALGDPTSNVKSGAMAALLKSEAVEANSGLQQTFFNALERVGTAIIRILKRYADAPRLIAIAGRDQQDGLIEFKKEDIANIDRVIVNAGSSMLRTSEGRWALFEIGLGKGELTLADGIEMLETGAIPEKYQRTNGQKSLVRKENETLMMGPPVGPSPAVPGQQAAQGVIPLMTDDHPAHILGHACILDSPAAREKPEVFNATMAHIMEHVALMETMDPRIALILGIKMLPPPDAVQPMPEGQGEQQGGPQPQAEPQPPPGADGEPAQQAPQARQAQPARPAPQGRPAAQGGMQ